MKAVGVTATKIRQLRREGYSRLSPDQLVGLVAVSGASSARERNVETDNGYYTDEDDDDGG
jgi:hypothetical protein